MQNPLPKADELKEAYSVEYAPYRTGWKETGWPLWRVLRELTTLRRVGRLTRYAKGSRLLEIGSGAGDFLLAAHKAGWEVAGVEYSERLADALHIGLRLDVRSGELTHGLWEPESFDLVVLWSVLEHVPNPLETLIIASSYLKKGGIVLIQLPTLRGVTLGGCFRQYWALLDLPRHLNFFGKEALSKLCNRAGMELTVFKTPMLDIAWCYLASCSNFANGSRNQVQRLVRFALLVPMIILALPYLAVLAWLGRGTEAFAVAIRR